MKAVVMATVQSYRVGEAPEAALQVVHQRAGRCPSEEGLSCRTARFVGEVELPWLVRDDVGASLEPDASRVLLDQPGCISWLADGRPCPVETETDWTRTLVSHLQPLQPVLQVLQVRLDELHVIEEPLLSLSGEQDGGTGPCCS